eukprot:scaffold1944_cov241-Pinguiococcus_pyrenoidosus.AAC.5
MGSQGAKAKPNSNTRESRRRGRKRLARQARRCGPSPLVGKRAARARLMRALDSLKSPEHPASGAVESSQVPPDPRAAR